MNREQTRISYVELVREAARWSVIARKQDALSELARLLEECADKSEYSAYSLGDRYAFEEALGLIRKLATGYELANKETQR